MLAHQRRYLGQRRSAAQDRQALLHPRTAFHGLFFLRAADDADVVEELAALRRATDTLGEIDWIYAGRAVVTAAHSKQIGAIDWDAVALLQFSSRQYHDTMIDSVVFRRALAPFAEVYRHGFSRPPATNLALPQRLLARRIAATARREPPRLPFVPVDDHELPHAMATWSTAS